MWSDGRVIKSVDLRVRVYSAIPHCQEKGDRILTVLIPLIKVQERMANLINADSHPTESCLLPIITLQPNAVLLVDQSVCSNGRMMRDLFRDEAGIANLWVLALPNTKKQLTQEGVEGLLFGPELLVTRGVLTAERRDKPFQNGESTEFRIGFEGGGDEKFGVLAPVGGVFDEGG
jgi:hypothetical protein